MSLTSSPLGMLLATGSDAVLRNHQHYFIVFAQVGTPLKDFKNSFELVQATSHAIEAHKGAYEQAKILHRDISVGNILITDEGDGLLIDWEFSKPLDSSKARLTERTGTWQFMSGNLLSHEPGEANHVLADDLESFYHVLCWVTLMHGRHGLAVKAVETQIARAYDAWHGLNESDAVGGEKKILDLLASRISS
uniref:Protein kinase domain-containing protein n=1 Tax=Moniliophthora roreri TaxID=221103 RepID=A0A0W0FRP8_MONRR